jgi:N-acetylglucosaminyldiphosphoundecaprenol N-acetyl-beta-D-mannosaminyltransferase
VDRSLEFAGLSFEGVKKSTLLREGSDLQLIVPVNAELIVLAHKNSRFRRLINSSTSTFDGYWPLFFARRRHRASEIDKISGSDLVYDISCFAAASGYSVFLLGASEDSNTQAGNVLRDRYGLRISGYSPPLESYPFSNATNEDILDRITAFRPEIVMVAFGAPKQEFWVDDHRDQLKQVGVRWVVAIGGSLDMVCGKLRRAPGVVQQLGCESLWRVAKEPRLRLIRFLNCFRFLQYI